MKVLLVNGSPNKNGCTYTALSIIAKTLKEEGVESEIYHTGKQPIGNTNYDRMYVKAALLS